MMGKLTFLDRLASLYRVANMADSDNPRRAPWTTPEMASTVCGPLDEIMRALVTAGALTAEEHQAFYDDL